VWILCVVCLSPSVFAAAVHDVRLWRAPDSTRLVFDLDAPVDHKVVTLAKPHRLVIDIASAQLKTNLDKVELKNSPISQIRSGVHNKSDLRIVLDLKEVVKPRSFVLSANNQYGDRLVVDLYDLDSANRQSVKKVDSVARQQRDIIIAIDAGHGGEDPGALGPNRIREKDVVLAISRELEKLLSSARGYSPQMIRTGDYYIGLKKRRELAREKRADLFVSVHADAFKNPQAHGSSVYVLSPKGATSSAAQFLADRENQADLIGGEDVSGKDKLVYEVLLDLSMTYKLSASTDAGHYVLRNMGKISRLHSRHVEKAAFAVLKSPDVPSILVETGFISNPTEAKNLNSPAYQRQIARAIFNGITGFFDNSPPDGTYIAWARKNRAIPKEYVVARGDTLSEIAQRYQVSITAIRKHNKLSSNSIRIGQKIVIPAS
jgi:N-acetylmuramoyl-L-alanine amidase